MSQDNIIESTLINVSCNNVGHPSVFYVKVGGGHLVFCRAGLKRDLYMLNNFHTVFAGKALALRDKIAVSGTIDPQYWTLVSVPEVTKDEADQFAKE